MSSDKAFRQAFSSKLRTLLNQKNSTQRELSDFMGVSTATISDWKNGKVTPRMDKIDKLCAYFHINREELVGDYFGKQYSDNGFMQFSTEEYGHEKKIVHREIFGPEERAMVYAYRCAPIEIQRIVDTALQPYYRLKDSPLAMERIKKLEQYAKIMESFVAKYAKEDTKKVDPRETDIDIDLD